MGVLADHYWSVYVPLPIARQKKNYFVCLFVCRGTLSCYGVGAFSLSIPYGIHLVVPAQLCSFGWYVIPTGHFPQKSLSRNLKNRFFPFPHCQTMPSYLWPMTSPCPVLVGYRLLRFGPGMHLSSMYIQNLSAAHAFAVVGLHSLSSVFYYFLVPLSFMACPT